MRRCHTAAAAHAARLSPLLQQPVIVARKGLKAERFLDIPHRFSLGLQPIREDEWLSARSDSHAAELALKAALLDGPVTRSNVLAALPGSETAQLELLEHIQSWTRLHGESTCLSSVDGKMSALERGARLVTEDVLLLESRGQDGWVLTAACVCFPSRWDLSDKIGRSMEVIHSPVPGLNTKLGLKINSLFTTLAAGKVVARMNSDVMDSPDLYQPAGFEADLACRIERGELAEVNLDNAGERLLLRLERQTLRRLPRSRAIAFTIKTYQIRLRDVISDFELADRLRRHYASMLGTPMTSGKSPYKRHVQTMCQWIAPRMSCQAMTRGSGVCPS